MGWIEDIFRDNLEQFGNDEVSQCVVNEFVVLE